MAPLKPTFNHLTANFADQDFAFVTNSVSVYDIDHASLIGGAGPLNLKSSVNLSGTSSKSQPSGARTRLASGSFKLDFKTFTYSVKKGFFRTPGLPGRIEATLPTACVVAAVVGVANNFGYGPYTTFPCAQHSEPFMPGNRTCNGGAYSFQIPGPLAVADTVVIPMRVHDSASIRCIFAYVQTPTTDGQSAYLVKYSRDDGATWQPLEYMGIAQMLPNGAKNTYDFMVEEGYGKPATRRLPYNDFGVVLYHDVAAGPNPQTVNTASLRREQTRLRCGRVRPRELGPGR